jgi:hypothetical protein
MKMMNISAYALLLAALVVSSSLAGKHDEELFVEGGAGETMLANDEAYNADLRKAEELEVSRFGYKNLLKLLLEREQINRRINELVNGKVAEANADVNSHDSHLVTKIFFRLELNFIN